jgi:hypothetical protein
MKFMTIYNIYCDESCHLENDKQKAMAIGGVWCPLDKKEEIFHQLRDLKTRHGLSSKMELKWNKVSSGQLDYYVDVVNYFFDNQDLHFRTLVVPNKAELDHEKFNQTHDEFYYKIYFDMLKTIFEPECYYNIYIDIKDTRSQEKVEKLQEVLCNSQYDFDRNLIRKIQQVRSHEVELVPLADFLTGAVCYANRGLTTSSAKMKIIETIKERSGYNLVSSTYPRESKFNVFIWKAGYGK